MRRNRHLDGMDEDIRHHLELETQENIARGMDAEEARQAALRKFGNVLQVREETRAVWLPVWIDQLAQDLRYAVRMLQRNPGFALVVVLTLALGVSVNTSVFSVVNAALIRGLPYPAADRLVAYSDGVSSAKAESFKPGVAAADFAEWRASARSFEALAGYDFRDFSLASSHDAGTVRVAQVAGDFWAITGGRAALGRLFGPSEAPGSVVLTYRYFAQRFKEDPRVVGQAMRLEGAPVTIVGVLSPEFRFLLPDDKPGIERGEMDVFAPATLARTGPTRMRAAFVAGRLKLLVSREEAANELQTIEARLLQAYPDRWFPGVARMTLIPLQDVLVGPVRRALLVLQIAGFFVLLISCANIANLLLARAAARQREIAIRAAIGAGRGRVLRQFLVEGLLLSSLGGVGGLLLARGFLVAMLHFWARSIPRLGEATFDLRVLAFCLALSGLCGTVFALSPALSLWTVDLQTGLRNGSGQSLGRSGFRVRRILVAFELALAVVLLTGAGLMMKSLWRLYTHPPGFAPEQTLTARVSLSATEYGDPVAQNRYLGELLRRIQSAPGVHAAGAAHFDPLLLQSADLAVKPIVDRFEDILISEGYFQAMGMRLIAGRWIHDGDPAEATVINESMARRVFGDRDPLGQRIEKLGRPVRVVGVAANLKYSKLDVEPGPELYRPYAPNVGKGGSNWMVVVRMPGDPLGFAPVFRRVAGGIDPTQPVSHLESLEQALSESIAPRRLNLFLLATFAGLAFLMAVVGIYGVMAYLVAQRTREVGIRMALGARREMVIRMVVRQGLEMTCVGIVIGLIAAFALTRFMESLLYEVRPDDPFTLGLVGVALAVTAALASWGPARRAAGVDPVTALRAE